MSGRSMTDTRFRPRAPRTSRLAASAAMLVLLMTAGCGFHLVTGDGHVSGVSICDDLGCDQEVLSGTSIISLRVNLDEAPYGTRVSSHWYYLEGPFTQRLLRERVTDLDQPQEVLHRLEPPRAGRWKAGLYRIDVRLRDRLVARRKFFIAPPPAPKQAAPVPPMPPPDKKDILDDEF